jgi:ABC-type tungstate transport system substrate-binding protein
MRFAWLSPVILPSIVVLVGLLVLTLLRAGRLPIFWILFNHGGVVLGRGVVEIHFHRR